MTTRKTAPRPERGPTSASSADEPAAFLYRVAGPGGHGEMWLAESFNGHVAHGRTAAGAVERLKAGMEALAASEGLALTDWLARQEVVHARVVGMRELLQD
ncbi:MAG TPA: hypothetical protein VFY93_06070 [Planctomycetota bacterium]|nr:hypothetical protein [Planctomycetota bacterium]